MGFFDDDPFEDIFQEFFGGRGRTSSSGNVVRSESEERVIDYIEEEDKVYFVFELPGFSKEDVLVTLKGDKLTVVAKRLDMEGVKDYLKSKLSSEISFSKAIPVKVKKGMEYKFNNGVLEVKFERK